METMILGRQGLMHGLLQLSKACLIIQQNTTTECLPSQSKWYTDTEMESHSLLENLGFSDGAPRHGVNIITFVQNVFTSAASCLLDSAIKHIVENRVLDCLQELSDENPTKDVEYTWSKKSLSRQGCDKIILSITGLSPAQRSSRCFIIPWASLLTQQSCNLQSSYQSQMKQHNKLTSFFEWLESLKFNAASNRVSWALKLCSKILAWLTRSTASTSFHVSIDFTTIMKARISVSYYILTNSVALTTSRWPEMLPSHVSLSVVGLSCNVT